MYRQDQMGRRIGHGQATAANPFAPSSSKAYEQPQQQRPLSTAVAGGWSFSGLPSLGEGQQHESSPNGYGTARQNGLQVEAGNAESLPASDQSWPDGDLQRGCPSLKRAGSPSLIRGGPNKRHQTYNSPGMMGPSRSLGGVANGLFSGGDGGDEQQYYEDARFPNGVHSPRVTIEISRSRSAVSGNGMMVNGSVDPRNGPSYHHPAPFPDHISSPAQSNSELGRQRNHQEHIHQATPFHRSLNQQPVLKTPVMMLKEQVQLQMSAPECRNQGRNYTHHDTDDDYESPPQNPYRRAQSTAPEIMRQRQHPYASPDLRLAEARSHQNSLVRPQVSLGSPIWHEAQERYKEVKARLVEHQFGQHQSAINKTAVGNRRMDRGRSELPHTPVNQRDSSQARHHEPNLQQRARTKCSLPNASDFPLEYAQPQGPIHQDLDDEFSEDEEDAPLNLSQVFSQRNAMRQEGYNFSDPVDLSPHRASKLLPQNNAFKNAQAPPQKQQPKSRENREDLQPQSPEIINLVSPPEDTPLVRSKPMKERIASAKKAVTKKMSTAKNATPKKARTPAPEKVEKVDEKFDSEELRQKRAAELIIQKETEGERDALEIALFGEIQGETEEERQRRLEQARAETRRARETKMEEDLANQEAEERLRLEKERLAQEAAEKDRIEKEREEDRKKVKREAERKRQEAADEKAKEEKRRKAAEIIETQRAKDAAEAKERERQKREAQEKAEKVQAGKEEIAKLKAKQEEARKQAASLTSAKIPSSDDGNEGDDNINNTVMEVDEEPLFVPENTPKARARSTGPASLAGIFAQARNSPAISNYRAERESMEAQAALKQSEIIRQRLEARWKAKDQSTKLKAPAAPEPLPVQERPKPVKAPKERPPPKPKGSNAIKAPKAPTVLKTKTATGFIVDSDDETDASTTKPVSQASAKVPKGSASQPTGNGSASSSLNNTKSASASLPLPPPPAPKVYQSAIKLTSDVEREKIEKVRLEKVAAKKRLKNEQARVARKKRDDGKARERKKQQLTDEAKENGIELSKEMLEAQVKAYMEKREKESQRRNENRIRKEQMQNFAPDNLALQVHVHQQPVEQQAASPETPENDADDEDETEESRIRKANKAAARSEINALARERGARFSAAASKKTVDDFQTDSEESEEDLDEPVVDKFTIDLLDESSDGEGDRSDDDDEVECGTQSSSGSASSPEMTGSSPGLSIDSPSNPPAPKPTHDRQVMIYMVFQTRTVNNHEHDPEHIAAFTDRDEANNRAVEEVQTLRQRHSYAKISESYSDSLLFSAMITMIMPNVQGCDCTLIFVKAVPKAPSEIAGFDARKLNKRLPEKSWVLRCDLEKVIEKEDGTKRERFESIKVKDFQYSELVEANHAACKYAFDFIRPKGANIDHVLQHENEWGEALRKARDELTEGGNEFAVEMEVDDTQLTWMKPVTKIEFKVEVSWMKGPLN